MAGLSKLNKYETLLGFVVGFLTPIFGITVMYDIYPDLQNINLLEDNTLKILITRVSTFGVIINAGLFFLGLQMNREKAAKGVLSASLIYVILIVVYKFIL